MLCFNYIRLFYAKGALFTVLVLELQTDFAARWRLWFTANDSSNEQVSSLFLKKFNSWFDPFSRSSIRDWMQCSCLETVQQLTCYPAKIHLAIGCCFRFFWWTLCRYSLPRSL